MNLSPAWVEFFKEFEIESVHWTSVGNINATDKEFFNWAKENNYIILTQDLDFSTILALSNSEKPSVVLIRAKSSLPEDLGNQLLKVLNLHSIALKDGAHVILDTTTARVRILPLYEI